MAADPPSSPELAAWNVHAVAVNAAAYKQMIAGHERTKEWAKIAESVLGEFCPFERLPPEQRHEIARLFACHVLAKTSEPTRESFADVPTSLAFSAGVKANQNLALRMFLDAGANVDARDRTGQTALMCAAYGNKEAVGMLLTAGANVNLSDRTGSCALMRAVDHGQDEIARMLRENGA